MREGNGNPTVTITAGEMGPGWMYFQVAQKSPDTSSVAPWLNKAMCDWLKANPAAVVRAVLPITELGDTVGIHLWHD